MSDDDKQRARIFLHRAQLAQARTAYEQAVADDRLANDSPALSDSLGNLGNVCALLGDLEQAEACYREVLTIQRTERNQHAIAHTLVNLGNPPTATRIGDFQKLGTSRNRSSVVVDCPNASWPA